MSRRCAPSGIRRHLVAPVPIAPAISVVIPAFNEADNLPIVVRESVQTLEAGAWKDRWELILVDDGSTDGTGAAADRLSRDYAGVIALHHAMNQGLGGALKTGYDAARGDYVTLISGDGEIGVDQALRLLEQIGTADLMVSRRVRAADVSRSVLTFGFQLLTRVLTGFDPSEMGGIYVIRRSVLQALRLRASTGVLNYEVLMQCAARRCEIRSGLMETRPRLSGRSKVTNLRTITRTVWELAKLRMRGES